MARSAPPVRAMTDRITPAVPATPKALPKVRDMTVAMRKAASRKMLGVISFRPL